MLRSAGAADHVALVASVYTDCLVEVTELVGGGGLVAFVEATLIGAQLGWSPENLPSG